MHYVALEFRLDRFKNVSAKGYGMQCSTCGSKHGPESGHVASTYLKPGIFGKEGGVACQNICMYSQFQWHLLRAHVWIN